MKKAMQEAGNQRSASKIYQDEARLENHREQPELFSKNLFLKAWSNYKPIAFLLVALWGPALHEFSHAAYDALSHNQLASETRLEPRSSKITLTMPSHRSLPRLLNEAGFSAASAEPILSFTKRISFRAGQKIILSYLEKEESCIIHSVRIPLNLTSEIEITRQPNATYYYQKKKAPVRTELVRVQGPLTHNIFKDLAKQGVPYQVAVPLVKALATAGLNWRLHARSKMKFSFLYKQIRNLDTSEVGLENLMFAKFSNKSQKYAAYRYQLPGSPSYKFYNDRGLSCHEEKFMRPVSGGRISSRFGLRKHAITCAYKMHTGVDIAAPSGTPVLASASGVVQKVCWHGGYGKCIRILHAKGFVTVYGHLKDYVPGLRAGQFVRQGQMIGYIGRTGQATGAHLHFEIRAGKNPINPLKTITYANELTRKQKAHFQSYVRHLWSLYHHLPQGAS